MLFGPQASRCRDARTGPAKDLGVFNLANAAPQSLASYIEAFLLATAAMSGEPNYALLVGAAAAGGIAGALVIIPIKKAK